MAKHAKANRVQVHPTQAPGKGILLAVEDDGRGFELGDAIVKEGSNRGLGLASMRERVKLSGGAFAVESNPDEGTDIRASWPCQESGITG